MNAIPAIPQTRSEPKARAISAYRIETLRRLTPVRTWGLLLAGQIALFLVLLFLLDKPLILVLALAASAFASATLSYRFLQHNREIRARAVLTPVLDLRVLRRQVAALRSAVTFITAAAAQPNDPKALRQAVFALYGAALPLMKRSETTIETASVAGYPPYPAVETMTMPGDDSDFLSFHVIRLEASCQKLETIVSNELVLAETVSQVTGEIIPPLRAIEAQLN